MISQALTSEQIQQYQQDGYLIVRGFLNPAEVEKLHQIALADSAVSKNAINVNDSTGKRSKLSLWYKPGDDVYGLLTRSRQLVESVDKLLDNPDAPVCHFHSKLMQKEPRVGGAWEWHQDYPTR
jgi:phytanoyl-CoA hydroxylase